MAYWRWDPTYSVGIAVIDEQHKRIIEYINELNKATLYQDNRSVNSVLLHLVDYTISHFSFEESLMEEANYTMLEAHKKVHQSFMQRIEFFKERYNNGEDITKQLMNELQMWLINHIQHEDKDYTCTVKKMLAKKEITPNENSNNKWLKGLISKFFK